MNNQIIEDELLFEEDIQLTSIKEYGFTWKDFSEQSKPIPKEGLKFEINFEGTITGEKIKGRVQGIDYLTVRADGRLFLDLHASIATDDGSTIYVKESGINQNGNLLLNMDFHTNDSRYNWLNHTHVWCKGQVNFSTGKVLVKGFKTRGLI